MKSYTDLEQSKKLAEILPLESADMAWCNNSIKGINYTDEYSANLYTVKEMKDVFDEALIGWEKYWELIPCWSLAALLDFLSANLYVEIKHLDTQWELDCRTQVTYAIELVDACVEMICQLKERNLL